MAEDTARAAAQRAYEEALRRQGILHDGINAPVGPHPGPDELYALEEAARMAAQQAYQAHMQPNVAAVPQQITMQQDPGAQKVLKNPVGAEPHHFVDNMLLQGNEQILQQLTADDVTRQQLLHILEQQRQRNEAAAAAERARQMRPDKHYFTISQDGMILEATATVTGFSPEVFLMTSVFDTLYEDDVPGFLCVKTQFWDKGEPSVEVFVRRRSVEGEWTWLASKVVFHVTNSEIPAVIIEETRVPDEDIECAISINRAVRITAILIQAADSAWLAENTRQQEHQEAEDAMEEENAENEIVTDDSETALQAIAAVNTHLPFDVSDTGDLLPIMHTEVGAPDIDRIARLEEEVKQNTARKKKGYDPYSVFESVRQGVSLDLGLTVLEPEEVKVATIVLSGRIPTDQVAPMVRISFHSQSGFKGIADQFVLESEKTTTPRAASAPLQENLTLNPPPISVINMSYTYMGNSGIDILSELLYQDNSRLRTLDISFCKIDEKGFSSLAKALSKRRKKKIPALKGLILSGNYMSPRAAAEVGASLRPDDSSPKNRKRKGRIKQTGYDTDTDSDEEDDDDFYVGARKRQPVKDDSKSNGGAPIQYKGLQVLHIAHASLSAEATNELLQGLGSQCTVRELNLSSNYFGAAGASALLNFLETKQRSRSQKPELAMPFLDRLDMSNNNLGDEGTKILTSAVFKRSKVQLVDLKLSSNSISSGGIETIMNKLLQHDLISLSLDKNSIGDQGCQLVAASLQSMKSIARLNLGFNQIGSRGILSLMRSLATCKSITYLGLSGNILRISGAMALAFTLSQHPRLEELDLDNCCLGKAAQCHLVAGIISNRWVPMKRLKGFSAGPPMVAIGALDLSIGNSSNEECLRIRKDEQMKTILQWMENNRNNKRKRGSAETDPLASVPDPQESRFLTPEYIATINEIHGTPSQDSYLRLLWWLSRIPFDDDELNALQKYFYEPDGGDGDRGSDGYVNLKLRGDLLAALDEDVADEIREDLLDSIFLNYKGSIGMDLDKMYRPWNAWEAFKGNERDSHPPTSPISFDHAASKTEKPEPMDSESTDKKDSKGAKKNESSNSMSGKDKKAKMKPRITMFPLFEQQLAELKSAATDLIGQEHDLNQHEIILTQYAEASLTILRQLRYLCMNSGFDGWPHSVLVRTRKVLIIDDSTGTRKLLSRHFEKAGFIVDTASNGAEGVEKLKESIYDIAFMDIQMPVMNGFEATKKLREWEDKMRPGCRQPICALTATYVDDFARSDLAKFKEAGLDVMESKPCNIPRLFKVVDDVAPMFSDLNINVMQRERSDQSFNSKSSGASTASLPNRSQGW